MINVTMGSASFELERKTKILDLIPENNKKQYFAAKVNNRLRELTYELSFDCNVELLDNSSYDSVKVYETSLRYLLAMAFHNLYPNYQIRISYNISRSLLVSILSPNNVVADSKMISSLKEEMQRLVDEDIPFVRKTITKEEAHEKYVQSNQLDKDAILKYRPEKNCHIYVCGDYENSGQLDEDQNKPFVPPIDLSNVTVTSFFMEERIVFGNKDWQILSSL